MSNVTEVESLMADKQLQAETIKQLQLKVDGQAQQLRLAQANLDDKDIVIRELDAKIKTYQDVLEQVLDKLGDR